MYEFVWMKLAKFHASLTNDDDCVFFQILKRKEKWEKNFQELCSFIFWLLFFKPGNFHFILSYNFYE